MAATGTPAPRPEAASPGARSLPNSSGTEPPRAKAPPNACDAHLHIIDPAFPTRSGRVRQGMAVTDYRMLQARIGVSRAVVVQAKENGTDHACLLDALRRLGLDNARGIGVVDPSVTDTDLRRLHEGGIRGVRFSVWNPDDAVVSMDMLEAVAKRVADFGWHIQLHASADQIAQHAVLLKGLPCPLVVDHMARLPPGIGPDHPAFRVVADLIEGGRTWVKLSGAYLNTAVGAPAYPDATRMAQAWVNVAPERLVWGSDWPHITESHKPDDALLFDLLTTWAGDEGRRELILVDNPAALYGFS